MKKYIFGLFFIIIIFSCSKDDSIIIEKSKVNLAPKNFEARISSISHNYVVVGWDTAIDPEGDYVSYSIYLNKNLISDGISGQEFKIVNLIESTNYNVEIIAKDIFGNQTTKVLSFTTEKYYLKFLKSYDYGNGNYAGGYSAGYPYNMIKTRDNKYIISGKSTKSNGDGYRFFVLKIDYEGNEIWKKFYEFQAGDAIDFRIIESSNGLIMVGNYFVLNLDINGNLIWQKKINSYDLSRGPNEIKSVSQDKYNNIYLVGSRSDSSNNSTLEAVLTKLDYLGNIIWEKTYRPSSTNKFVDIKINSLNQLIILGNKDTSGTTYQDILNGNTRSEQIDFWILKVDSNGEIIWQNSFGDKRWDNSSQIILKNNGNYVFIGNSWGAYDVSNGRIFEIDTNGNKILDINSESFSSLNSIAETLDGGYITSGYNNSGFYDSLGIYKFDRNGNSEWQQKYYEDYTFLFGYSILTELDGGYRLVGNSAKLNYYGDEKPKIIVYKTDPMGNYK